MALDLAALRAKLAAQSAANKPKEIINETDNTVQSSTTAIAVIGTGNGSSVSNTGAGSEVAVQTVSSPSILGTSKTTEIDHLAFLSKMNALATAIHNKHPTMPVLLMQIHKQLRADPELVTTLDEDAIGIIVSGLQIQTKTELVSVVVKESKSKAKKTAVTLDML